jgi:hypothetical protein
MVIVGHAVATAIVAAGDGDDDVDVDDADTRLLVFTGVCL